MKPVFVPEKMTMTKKECLDTMNAQIDDWKCKMKALEDKAADAGEDVKARRGKAMGALRCQCQEGEAKLEEWKARAELEGLAATHAEKLNWKTSIVDLLKVLGLDGSLTEREELVTELGCPADKLGDSAHMNVWLHKTVLPKLAENDGNIPKELLH